MSKKSASIINVITGLAIAGLATGSCVLILVMAVFNGLEGTILSFFNHFNPDIKITATEGKTFSLREAQLDSIRALTPVKDLALVLEEIALFEYEGKQEVGRIKGVSHNYTAITPLDSAVIEGSFTLNANGMNAAVAGIGIGSSLGLNVLDPFTPIAIYAINEEYKPGLGGQNFKKTTAIPSGLFHIQQDYDSEYVFAPLEMVQHLLQRPNQYSALELHVTSDSKRVKQQLLEILGSSFTIANRLEQEKEFLRLMQIEKWLAFLMLSLAALLVAFNLIGALWMIVIDKRADLTILQCLGMTKNGVRNVVLTLGGYITAISIALGLLVAIVLIVLQKKYALIGVPDQMAMTAYPVDLRVTDIVATAIIILCIGLLASIPAARRAMRIPAYYKSD